MNSSRKFRVAVKERGEWIVHDPPHHFYLSPGGGLVRATDKGVRMYAGEHEATFYTGLTDAEGTEIYEGDFITYKNTSAPSVPPQLILWSREACGWARYHPKWYDKPFPIDESLCELSGLEVIGNRHEDPNLLEEFN